MVRLRVSVAIFINAGLLPAHATPGLACGLHSGPNWQQAARQSTPRAPFPLARVAARSHRVQHPTTLPGTRRARASVVIERLTGRAGPRCSLPVRCLAGRRSVPRASRPSRGMQICCRLTTGGGGIPRAGFPGSSLRSLRSLRPITGRPLSACRALGPAGTRRLLVAGAVR